MSTVPPPGEDPGVNPGDGPDDAAGQGKPEPGPPATGAGQPAADPGRAGRLRPRRLPLGVRVPDDASALSADLRQWRREQAVSARLARWRRLTRRAGPATVPVRVVVLALVLLGILALVAFLRPPTPAGPSVPLASPTVAAGSVGGLLPDVALRTGGGDLSTRSLRRPAMLMLLPSPCLCSRDTGRLTAQAGQAHVPTYLIAAGTNPREVTALAVASNGPAAPLLDPQGTLQDVYQVGSRPVLVLVQADGAVRAVVDPAGYDSRRLSRDLAALTAHPPPPGRTT